MAQSKCRTPLECQTIEPTSALENVQQFVVQQFLLDDDFHARELGIALKRDFGQFTEGTSFAHDGCSSVSVYSCISSR